MHKIDYFLIFLLSRRLLHSTQLHTKHRDSMPSSGLAVINLWMQTQNGVSTRNETNAPSTKLTLNANMEELQEFLYQKDKRGVHDLFRLYEKLINWRA